MACFHPISIVYDRANRRLVRFNQDLDEMYIKQVFNGVSDFNPNNFENCVVPCGHCIGCSYRETRSWALRVLSEVYMRQHFVFPDRPLPWCFVTLTYDDEHLPRTINGKPTLNYKDLRKFIQKVKDTYYNYDLCDFQQEGQKAPWQFYYNVGEYGDEKGRPHFHCLFVGIDFFELDRRILNGTLIQKQKDKFGSFPEKHCQFISKNKEHYNTPLLSYCWDKGFAVTCSGSIGAVCYVVGYSDKKRLSRLLIKDYYRDIEPEKGVFTQKIGRSFVEKFYKDIYNRHSIRLFDKEFPIPRYFDKRTEVMDPEFFARIKEKRLEYIKTPEYLEASTTEQLKAKEIVLLQKYANRIKPLEGLTGEDIFGKSYFTELNID